MKAVRTGLRIDIDVDAHVGAVLCRVVTNLRLYRGHCIRIGRDG